MPPDLSSANWKIDRALELLHGLDTEVLAWHHTIPAGYHIYIDPEFTRASVTVKEFNPPPIIHWSLIFADIVHNLRCALDHTFWALLQEQFPSGITAEAERLSFPIWDIGPNANLRKNFKPIDRKILAAVESVQPYNKPTGEFPVHPLAIIRDIDNGNKHRLLFSLVHLVARLDVRVSNLRHPNQNFTHGELYRGEIKNDIEVMATEFQIPEPYMKYECLQFMSIIAVRHPVANRLGQDRDDYATLVDSLIVWVRKTIADFVLAAS
jgi:hypothetical protein